MEKTIYYPPRVELSETLLWDSVLYSSSSVGNEGFGRTTIEWE